MELYKTNWKNRPQSQSRANALGLRSTPAIRPRKYMLRALAIRALATRVTIFIAFILQIAVHLNHYGTQKSIGA